jgi:hypothetical protein
MVATPETGDRLTTSSIGHKRDLRRDNGRKLMVFGRCADRVSPRFLAYSGACARRSPGRRCSAGQRKRHSYELSQEAYLTSHSTQWNRWPARTHVCGRRVPSSQASAIAV